MIDLDDLAVQLVSGEDEHRTVTMARLSVITEDDEGRLTETTYTIDFYRESDYQYNTSVRPLSRV